MNTATTTTTKYTGATYEQFVQAVTSRWSVQDLVEQTNADLERADELFYKSKNDDYETIEQGQHHYIHFWRIRSGSNVYEVRRFRNFFFCSCKSFFFNKKICKHGAISCGVMCSNCHQLSAKAGKLCYDCDVKAHGFMRSQPQRPTATSL